MRTLAGSVKLHSIVVMLLGTGAVAVAHLGGFMPETPSLYRTSLVKSSRMQRAPVGGQNLSHYRKLAASRDFLRATSLDHVKDFDEPVLREVIISICNS